MFLITLLQEGRYFWATVIIITLVLILREIVRFFQALRHAVREAILDHKAKVISDKVWSEWTSYKNDCAFCRLQKAAFETGDSDHERINLSFNAGIIYGYSARAKGQIDRVLCPLHLKDAYRLEADILKIFPKTEIERDVP